MLDYRPTPKQRTTLELLRYLSIMGPQILTGVRTGNFSGESWGAAVAEAEKKDFAAVVSSLESLNETYSGLASWSDEELRAELDMFGFKAAKGRQIVHWIVSGHAAYRTQLFCYLKSCGREELNTMNLWGGIDG